MMERSCDRDGEINRENKNSHALIGHDFNKTCILIGRNEFKVTLDKPAAWAFPSVLEIFGPAVVRQNLSQNLKTNPLVFTTNQLASICLL